MSNRNNNAHTYMFVYADPVISLTDRLIQTFFGETVISLTSVIRMLLCWFTE